MANNLKGNEARNRDPELDKSDEQIQRIRERLENLSLTDYLELAGQDADHYVRMCAAQEAVKEIQDLDHAKALNTIQRLIETEGHEWVYNEYLEFLYRRTGDIASYHDQLDLLRYFATNDASELKRWLAMDKLLRVKAKIKETPPWLEQFMRDRILSDPSNWLRAQIADGILFMITFDPDQELKYFALQWALHTGCCGYPSSYGRADKDPKYFSSTEQLLNSEPNINQNSGNQNQAEMYQDRTNDSGVRHVTVEVTKKLIKAQIIVAGIAIPTAAVLAANGHTEAGIWIASIAIGWLVVAVPVQRWWHHG